MLCNVYRTFVPKFTLTSIRAHRNITTASVLDVARRMAGRQTQQNFDYFLVLDFEATCDNQKRLKPQEIIEFPVLKIDAKTFQTEATFHQYVQPRVHSELSSFCTELTGIVQDMVDGKPFLEDTLKDFDKWMLDQGLLNEGTTSAFVTCGDWDLNIMLPNQAKYFSIDYPGYLKTWINIKKSFADLTGEYAKGMLPMLKKLMIRHEGRHHSGIDDCHNIAKILKALGERGYIFRTTGSLEGMNTSKRIRPVSVGEKRNRIVFESD